VLLAPRLPAERAAALLRPYGFADPRAADRNLQQIAEDPRARELLAQMLPELLAALARSADPDAALLHLERFMRASLSPVPVLSALAGRPSAVELLCFSFGASPFLAEILVRNPSWFHWLSDPSVLEQPRSREAMADDLDHALATLRSEARQLDALRLAKRRGLLHIAARDLLRLASVDETIVALSSLADVLIQKAWEIADDALRLAHGLPPRPPPRSPQATRFTVLGFGKLGGEELNFSSDVDLVYLYASDRGRVGRFRGSVKRTDYALSLARRLTSALAARTAEGAVYRVDLRLRPEGGAGAVAHSLPAFRRYYRTRGSAWERLALLKARPLAGDLPLGRGFLEAVEPFLFERPFDADAVRAVLRMKRESDRRLAERGESSLHVKLGTGGIREVELIVQALQLRHGRRRRSLRQRGSLAALHALREAGILPEPETSTLARAYLFLRDVENKLQMAADTQVHSLPRSASELRACALKLGYRDEPHARAEAALRGDYAARTDAVHRIFLDVFRRLEEDDTESR
jgi:glutamate-ammonia-ligase adenylyltransferase